MKGMTYGQARLVVLAIGSVLIATVTLSSFLLGADLVEVAATGLLLPIFFAAAFFGPIGGVAAAALTSIGYVTLRLSTLPPGADSGAFSGSIVTRVGIYVAIGFIGATAMNQLQQSLRKLELYDEIDDETGVGNARSVLSLTDREASRAQRYGSVFSIGVIEIDHEVFDAVPRRKAVRALRAFVQDADEAARSSDAVARVQVQTTEHVMMIMPETGTQGAEVAIERLLARAREDLGAHGMPTSNGFLRKRVLTLPGDEQELERLQESMNVALGAQALRVDA